MFDVIREDAEPSLVPAVKFPFRIAGRNIHTGSFGETHHEIEQRVWKHPDNVYNRDFGIETPEDYGLRHEWEGGNPRGTIHHGFVNHKGQFLNRAKAFDYATQNGLLNEDAVKHYYGEDEKPTELDNSFLTKFIENNDDPRFHRFEKRSDAEPSLVPAMNVGGKLFKGKLGDTHVDIVERHNLGAGINIDNWDTHTGFVNHKGHFLNRSQAFDYATKHFMLHPNHVQRISSDPAFPGELTSEDLDRNYRSKHGIPHPWDDDKMIAADADEEYTPMAKKAVEHYGVTDNPKEGGYILSDGKMLDFSGRHDAGFFTRDRNYNVFNLSKHKSMFPSSTLSYDPYANMRDVDHSNVGELYGASNQDIEDTFTSHRENTYIGKFSRDAKALRFNNQEHGGLEASFVPAHKHVEHALGHLTNAGIKSAWVDAIHPETGQTLASKQFNVSETNPSEIRNFLRAGLSGSKKGVVSQFDEDELIAADADPYLISVVRDGQTGAYHVGKMGEDHLSISNRNGIDWGNSGIYYKNHKGQILDRNRAAEYALANDLIAPQYVRHFKRNPNLGLISEHLKSYAGPRFDELATTNTDEPNTTRLDDKSKSLIERIEELLRE